MHCLPGPLPRRDWKVLLVASSRPFRCGFGTCDVKSAGSGPADEKDSLQLQTLKQDLLFEIPAIPGHAKD